MWNVETSTNFSNRNSRTLFCLAFLVAVPPIRDFVSSYPCSFWKWWLWILQIFQMLTDCIKCFFFFIKILFSPLIWLANPYFEKLLNTYWKVYHLSPLQISIFIWEAKRYYWQVLSVVFLHAHLLYLQENATKNRNPDEHSLSVILQIKMVSHGGEKKAAISICSAHNLRRVFFLRDHYTFICGGNCSGYVLYHLSICENCVCLRVEVSFLLSKRNP